MTIVLPSADQLKVSKGTTIHFVNNNIRTNGLILWKDVPEWLQFNRYITSEYRPMLPILSCACTLCSIHNETANVLSHLVPGIWLLSCSMAFVWDSKFILALSTSLLSLTLLLSAVYHLFMPACKTRQQYLNLLTLDVLGAVCGSTGSAIPFVLFPHRCLPMIGCIMMLLFGIVSLYTCFIVVTRSHHVGDRVKIVGMHSAFRAFLFLIGVGYEYFVHGQLKPSFYVQSCSLLFLAIGAGINVSRCPERWSKFSNRWISNCLINSHTIWHCFSATATLLAYYGSIMDIDHSNQYDIQKC